MEISSHFSGILKFRENADSYDAAFSVDNGRVTMIPWATSCQKAVRDALYRDKHRSPKQWLCGYTEDNCSIAILKNSKLAAGFTSGTDLRVVKFSTPLIIKSTAAGCRFDLKTFDRMEFYGGIVDLLYPPSVAIKEDPSGIAYRNREDYTKTYPVEINGEWFEVQYTVSFADLSMETGKVSDYRNSIHSVMRFLFPENRPVENFEQYFNYGLRLFQFCTGRSNIWSEIRLYGNQISRPMLTWINDGFIDYANDALDVFHVISLPSLGNRLPNLLKLLNEVKTDPRLSFLPKRNRDAASVGFTDITDMCVAFEREYALAKDKAKEDLVVAAEALTERLLDEVNRAENCPEAVKTKAKSILSQLKSYSPSLRDKIKSVCGRFRDAAKPITEQPGHDGLGIATFYDEDAFNKKIRDFVALRNQASHASVIWNGGEEIIPHLKLYIYFSVLFRTGYTKEESSIILDWLFNRFF